MRSLLLLLDSQLASSADFITWLYGFPKKELPAAFFFCFAVVPIFSGWIHPLVSGSHGQEARKSDAVITNLALPLQSFLHVRVVSAIKIWPCFTVDH